LTYFWCKFRKDRSYFKLSIVSPFDVSTLRQEDSLIFLSDSDILEEGSSQSKDEEDSVLELDRSDLVEHLQIDGGYLSH
jgi:hypothetical protein